MHSHRKIAVIGIGQIGLNLSQLASRKQPVLGYDIDVDRVEDLKQGFDINNPNHAISLSSNLTLTTDPAQLASADFYIVTVSTQVDSNNQPDIQSLKNASKLLAKQLKQGDIVVYESSIFPGGTEEVCIPLLEEISGLHVEKDFFVGFSPHRVNFGDLSHQIKNIPKLVAAQNEKVLMTIKKVYENFIDAEIVLVSSIKVAETAKLFENVNRDVGIGLANELAKFSKKMNINTQDVIAASATKWNFNAFEPGLVGGTCIPINPYYLLFKGKQLGLPFDIIKAARRVNETMGEYLSSQLIKLLLKSKVNPLNAKIALLGVTYKANYACLNGSKIFDIVNPLKEYGLELVFHDPIANVKVTKETLKIDLYNWDSLNNVTAFIVLIAHDFYKNQSIQDYLNKLGGPKIIMDIKGLLDQKACKKNGITLWRL